MGVAQIESVEVFHPTQGNEASWINVQQPEPMLMVSDFQELHAVTDETAYFVDNGWIHVKLNVKHDRFVLTFKIFLNDFIYCFSYNCVHFLLFFDL